MSIMGKCEVPGPGSFNPIKTDKPPKQLTKKEYHKLKKQIKNLRKYIKKHWKGDKKK